MGQDFKTVFVVHGRNMAAREAMFTFLRSIGLKPLEWHQAVSLTGTGAPYIGQILDRAGRLVVHDRDRARGRARAARETHLDVLAARLVGHVVLELRVQLGHRG